MSHSPKPKPHPIGDHRRWERLDHVHPLNLVLEGSGPPWPCVTKDVSLSGVLLEVLDEGADDRRVLPGMRGALQLLIEGQVQSFPCEVVRVRGRELALNLFDKQAAFGMAMTHDIFSRLRHK